MAARFFMNLRHRTRLFRDEEGDDLDGESAVRAHALATAKDLIRLTRTNSIRDWYDCSFEVTDVSGRTVCIVPFGDTVREPEDAEA
jgi:hypothetical protein